jgi:hypothetical protein
MKKPNLFKPKKEISCPCCKSAFRCLTFDGSEADCPVPTEVVLKGPKAGDFVVCWNCATILCFDKGPQLREADLNDLLKLSEKSREHLGFTQFKIRVENNINPKDKM